MRTLNVVNRIDLSQSQLLSNKLESILASRFVYQVIIIIELT